jgi:hypothetical protein
LSRGRCYRPAAFLVSDVGGLGWFVCGAHAQLSATAQWIAKTPIADWFTARGQPVPRREALPRCPTVAPS